MFIRNSMKNKKIAVTFVAAILLLVLYSIIFSFSAQDADESGNLSMMISQRCVDFINTISGSNWDSMVRKQLAEYFEHPIRKLAHFSEYAYMGVLVFVLLVQYINNKRLLYILVTLWVFVSATLDEFHQLFVPGRYGSFIDVMLDTCGGICGILLCVFLTKISKNIKYKL